MLSGNMCAVVFTMASYSFHTVTKRLDHACVADRNEPKQGKCTQTTTFVADVCMTCIIVMSPYSLLVLIVVAGYTRLLSTVHKFLDP